MIRINEIFYSIQGEGTWAGLPNIFIRTTGCNLRCNYCDTKYSYENGVEMSISEILQKIKKIKCKNICITGGEPLIQENIFSLINELLKQKYNIFIETNGSLPINDLINNEKLNISMDIKCPSSQMNEEMNFKNIELLRKNDQIKFVIKNKDDFEYAKSIINKYKIICRVYFQPVWGNDTQLLANWILKDKLNVYLGQQLHKIIWGEKRGV